MQVSLASRDTGVEVIRTAGRSAEAIVTEEIRAVLLEYTDRRRRAIEDLARAVEIVSQVGKS